MEKLIITGFESDHEEYHNGPLIDNKYNKYYCVHTGMVAHMKNSTYTDTDSDNESSEYETESDESDTVDIKLPSYILEYESAEYDIDARIALKIPPKKIIFDEYTHDRFETMLKIRKNCWPKFKERKSKILGWMSGGDKKKDSQTYLDYYIEFYDFRDAKGVRMKMGWYKNYLPAIGEDHIVSKIYAHSYYVQTGEACESDTDSD